MSFVLSLVLNGVMSQLWNIFNTLQIIMALPLLPLIIPTNIELVRQTINNITNVQIVEKSTINEAIVEPVFGSSEDSEDGSMIVQLFQTVAAIIVVLLLILLLLFCRKKILPKCPSAIQNLVKMIEGKLMFNSIIRALMQTYLQNCLIMWTTIAAFESSTTQKKVETFVALALLAFSVALPIWSQKFLKRHKDDVQTTAFKQKYDSLYQNVNYHDLRALAYTSFFLGRRLFFAFVICVGPHLVLQIALIDLASTVLLNYFTSILPMVDKVNNFI